ncbi:unnamed protein product [Rangifer tarandus platyrhynchus]|uniref:Uncharacterized protein n=1 Tax=Rangifer tarandus platyrhynchus TaxID=3082113 RepID=A0ABN8YJZ2_RANTA|nr:unnamed protein product [Rangifer tarandus platyrhynchus]
MRAASDKKAKGALVEFLEDINHTTIPKEIPDKDGRSQERHPDLVAPVVERDTPDEMLESEEASEGVWDTGSEEASEGAESEESESEDPAARKPLAQAGPRGLQGPGSSRRLQLPPRQGPAKPERRGAAAEAGGAPSRDENPGGSGGKQEQEGARGSRDAGRGRPRAQPPAASKSARGKKTGWGRRLHPMGPEGARLQLPVRPQLRGSSALPAAEVTPVESCTPSSSLRAALRSLSGPFSPCFAGGASDPDARRM